MTRFAPLLAAAAAAAFLAFGGARFRHGDRRHGNGGIPAAGRARPAADRRQRRRDSRTAAMCAPTRLSLDGPARRAFIWRCQQGGDF